MSRLVPFSGIPVSHSVDGDNIRFSGLPSQSKGVILTVMVRGTASRGTKKCRKSTVGVGSVSTMLVISTALGANYCPLNHNRNGYPYFVNRLSLIQ